MPIEATMAIVIWIALIITSQAFQATPAKHAPAVVVGLIPGIAAWGVLMMKSGIRAGLEKSEHPPMWGEWVLSAINKMDIAATGAFAIEQGALFTAMLWATLTVCIIEHRFCRAGWVAIICALFSISGLMHGFIITPGDVALQLARLAMGTSLPGNRRPLFITPILFRNHNSQKTTLIQRTTRDTKITQKGLGTFTCAT